MTRPNNSIQSLPSHKIYELIIPDQPLLIVDADEVLLQFVKALESFLLQNGYYIQFDSFQLNGNIRDKKQKKPINQAQTSELIADFFTHDVEKIEAVSGAQKALMELNSLYQIVILSNVPSHVEERRKNHLKSLGMDYPLIANSGGKGLAAKELSAIANAQTVFIDDLPPQHSSVAEHANHIHRIHMIADKRLSKLIGKAEDAHARIDQWNTTSAYLIKHLKM
jgi:hypothetical protein